MSDQLSMFGKTVVVTQPVRQPLISLVECPLLARIGHKNSVCEARTIKKVGGCEKCLAEYDGWRGP